MSTDTVALTVSEQEGRDRSIALATLVDHPGAISDATVIDPSRRGRAVPVRLLMSTEEPFVVATDASGTYTACIPTVDLLHGGHLLVGTPDSPLAESEGGPIRLIVSDGSTLCWNVKQVASLRAVPQEVPDSIPANPGH